MIEHQLCYWLLETAVIEHRLKFLKLCKNVLKLPRVIEHHLLKGKMNQTKSVKNLATKLPILAFLQSLKCSFLSSWSSLHLSLWYLAVLVNLTPCMCIAMPCRPLFSLKEQIFSFKFWILSKWFPFLAICVGGAPALNVAYFGGWMQVAKEIQFGEAWKCFR